MANRSGASIMQRWGVTLHAVALVLQITFALLWLAGLAGAPELHASNAWAVLALAVLQAVTFAPAGPASRARFFVAAVIIVLVEAAQIRLGRTGSLGAHVTLGTLIWAGSLALLIQVWAPSWGQRMSPSASATAPARELSRAPVER